MNKTNDRFKEINVFLDEDIEVIYQLLINVLDTAERASSVLAGFNLVRPSDIDRVLRSSRKMALSFDNVVQKAKKNRGN